MGLNLEKDTYRERSEFGENAHGKVGTKPPVFETGLTLQRLMAKNIADIAIDDCLDGDRDEELIVQLVRDQMEYLKHNKGAKRIVHTLKIDIKVASIAYHSKNINPHFKAPTPAAVVKAQELIERFVKAVWDVDPEMKITMECTVLSQQKFSCVPSLKPEDARVDYQGQHLENKAIPVVLSEEDFKDM